MAKIGIPVFHHTNENFLRRVKEFCAIRVSIRVRDRAHAKPQAKPDIDPLMLPKNIGHVRPAQFVWRPLFHPLHYAKFAIGQKIRTRTRTKKSSL